MNPTLLTVAERVVAALGNGFLQGLAVALVAWAALRTLRRASAATRYAVECAALAVIALLPVAHLALSFLNSPEPPPTELGRVRLFTPTPSLVQAPIPAPHLEAPFEVGQPGAASSPAPMSPRDPFEGTAADRVEPASVSVAESALPTALTAPDGSAESVVAGTPEAAPGWADPGPGLHLPVASTVAAPAPLILGLALAWFLVALTRLALLTRQLVALRRIKRDAETPPTPVATAFDGLRRTIAPRRDAALGIGSDAEIAAPMAAGYLHPMVLLPAGLVDAPAPDFEHVLRHELAHLRRGDDWTNLAQHLVRAVLFFHPAVIWLSRRMDIDREIACDDHVLAAAGRERAREYALFLTDFARRTHGRTWSAAPAAWSNPTQLEERIRMLLNPHRNTSPRTARAGAGAWIAGLALLAALGLYATPRLSLAASAGDAPSGIAKEAAPAAMEVPAPQEIPVPVPNSAPPLPATPPALPPEPPEPPSADLAGPEAPPKRDRSPARLPADATVEQRIERLERLVESLARRPGSERPTSTSRSSSGPRALPITPTPPDVKPPKISSTIRTDLDLHTDSAMPAVRDIMAEVGRHVELATREAERAVRAALESARSALDSSEPKRAENIDQRRKALAEERRALQKQMAKVESQLEQLDGQLERVDDLLDHQADAAQSIQESRKAQESLSAELRALTEKARARARAAVEEARNSGRRALIIEKRIDADGDVHEERILRSGDGRNLELRTPDGNVLEVRPPRKPQDANNTYQPAPKEEPRSTGKIEKTPATKTKDKSGDAEIQER